MRRCISFLLLLFFVLMHANGIHAQNLKGILLDKQSDEPIPFAAIQFKKSGKGTLTDSLGKFSFQLNGWPAADTIRISSVGYQELSLPVSSFKDSVFLTIKIEVLAPVHEVVVKAKYNRALWFWRKIIANKPKNDKHHFDNYGYEVYNKLEADISNVNKEKLEKSKVLKQFDFVLNYIDTTSEEQAFLPVYITETLSDFYFQNQPRRTREVIKATITNGLQNESMIKQLGATYQNVDVYNNNIPVFDKQFVSPLSDNADNFYNFKLLDTQYLNQKRLVHLKFTPKRVGENTFTGDCWVHDTSFAIQKITLRPAIDANVNFVTGLTLIQEFKLIYDTVWFLYKDKFVADLSLGKKEATGVKARKTTTYKNVLLNSPLVLDELNKSKPSEDIILLPNTKNKSDSFWMQSRHEPLNKSEQTVYALLDTLTNNPAYNRYRNTVSFLTTGVKDIGSVRIGPWYNWISGDQWEGTRVRFDMATNTHFNKHIYLHGYLAYGFKDQAFKGKAEIKYLFSHKPWGYALASYKNDLDNGQVYYDQLGSDNVFASFLRKPGVPSKYQQVTEKKIELYKETNNGFGFGITASNKEYKALLNLPNEKFFPTKTGEPFNNFETQLRIHYAYQERIIEDNFYRSTLGSEYPIVELRYAHGFPGVCNSSYKYDKLDVSVSDYLNITPYGTLYYNFFAGKIFGTLPYQLLDIQPGNEWYYYSRYSFNLMNRFEYLTDRYAGFNLEHNIGSGVFRYISFTRKWKFRQFWEAKGVVGNLSDANKQLNFVGDYPFKSLDNKLYLELGTGVDNIFKLFRVDFIWRVLPQPLSQDVHQRFGVFAGFRVSL